MLVRPYDILRAPLGVPLRVVSQFHQPVGAVPVTLHPFTITASTITLAANTIGGRPCLSHTAGGASKYTNLATAVANFPMSSSRGVACGGSVYIPDVADQGFVLGFGAYATDLIGGGASMAPKANTALVALYKAPTASALRIYALDGSGTANSFDTGITLASATWYDLVMCAYQTSATAGIVRVAVAEDGIGTGRGAHWQTVDKAFTSEFPGSQSLSAAYGVTVTTDTAKAYTGDVAFASIVHPLI